MVTQDSQQCILVLDDDAGFRSLISQIFNSFGYTICEARNVREANHALRANQPVLAIVDYRLQESDGISWITSVREAGNKIPIVFLSGTFCDARTFSKLRNILNVALVLQKPIVPQLFVEQVEGLLPKISANRLPGRDTDSASAVSSAPVQQQTQPHLSLPANLGKALLEAKHEFSLQLPSMVQVLAAAIQTAREVGNDRQLLQQAANEAHKIKGSAGSFGFTKVAEDAAKIEQLLKEIEPDDNTLQEILWWEIIRHLAEAEAATASVLVSASGEQPVTEIRTKSKSAHSVLMVTDSDDAIDMSLDVNINIAEVVVVRALKDALVTMQAQHFDAVIVDHGVCGEENILNFTKQVRLSIGHEALPLAFLLTDCPPYGASELLYLGCSLLIDRPLTLPVLEQSILSLISLYVPCLPRVLTVDDDPTLSGLIRKVLTTEDMVVHELNEPIRILEVLEEFQPDIVVLDVIMPGLSGYDVCRMLRSEEKWRHLIVIFLTSKSDAEGRSAAAQAGGNDFLAKPIVTSELINRVKAQVHGSPLIRQRMDRDQVTGLLQRGTFETAYTSMVARAKNDHRDLTVCVMDIEALNILRQSSGEEVEQKVLSTLGLLLQIRFRTQDVKAKLGAYFVLLIEGETIETLEDAMQLLSTEFYNLPFESRPGEVFNASLRYGLAQLFRDTEDATEMIRIALKHLGNQEKLVRQ